MQTETDISRIERLMLDATGDEKHDGSAHSTLDVLWVLYDRVLRYDPANPRWEGRDRFVLSKGHGPMAYYAILADKGFFPVINNHTSSINFGDLAAKFASFGWTAMTIDGRDHEQIYEALTYTDDQRPIAVIAEVKRKGA